MIREDLFVTNMTAHWVTLGNCPSSSLQQVWKQLCRTFNEQISAEDDKWRVVQPATGTGKSQGLALYAAMHTDQPEVGMLIVVRLISQADEMAALINRLAGQEIAKARHTENALTVSEMANTQILVVTHKAYELSLDKYSRGNEQKFDSFTTYRRCFEGKRQLIVIDESLDIVKQYQVELDNLAFVLGMIPSEIRSKSKHSNAFRYLEALYGALREVHGDSDDSERLVTIDMDDLPVGFSLDELREDCRQVQWDEVVLGVESLTDRNRLSRRVDQTLEASHATLEQWRYYSKKGKRHTLNTSALVVPEDVQGAVVLDATASQNLIYLLFSDKAEIKPVVEARSYQQVTLHVARVAGVGKGTMVKRADRRVRDLVSDLCARVNPDSRVFICSHKDIEPLIAQYATPFEMSTGHWGAIDGLNDYQHCDTFVCFGLPYRDRISSNNTYLACKGPQGDEWFRQKSKRADHGYEDIRRAIEQQQMAVDVIQALNRIRVRRVVDAEGNCKKSDCYLLLGQDEASEKLLDNIRKAMPGIAVKDWPLTLEGSEKVPRSKRNYSRSRYTESVCKFLEGQTGGQWSSSHLREKLNIPADRWKSIAQQMKTEGSALQRRLSELGWRLLTEGQGRGARSYIKNIGAS